jgi:hypothetical protein
MGCPFSENEHTQMHACIKISRHKQATQALSHTSISQNAQAGKPTETVFAMNLGEARTITYPFGTQTTSFPGNV